MIHIIVGDEAANNLKEAMSMDENLQGEILVLKDTLGIGDIDCTPEISHDEIRTSFWKNINPHFNEKVEDEKNILHLLENALQQEEPVCMWLAACVSDVCAYYWLLQYFKNHENLYHTINIIGLPFFNLKGQLFYPTNFSQIPPKEFIKTKRLLKQVTPAEYELEIDEWKSLQHENKWIRIYEGGKKVISKEADFFDKEIKQSITGNFHKGTKIVNDAMKVINQTISNLYIEYRLRKIIVDEPFSFNGSIDAPLKDIEIKNLLLKATNIVNEEVIE